ncbi:MAG: hypothetical protein HFJ49_05075 [Clostridia bacterium]|nr:hypothetical protein [Clostridia bacterium]
MKDDILKMYFQDGMKQIEIARELNISKYKVSRVITSDIRYYKEKEKRKKQNREKHIEKTRQCIYQKREREFIISQQLKQSHIQATNELSGRKTIDNQTFRKWNASIYKYNNKTNAYHLKNGIITSSDVPKKIYTK